MTLVGHCRLGSDLAIAVVGAVDGAVALVVAAGVVVVVVVLVRRLFCWLGVRLYNRCRLSVFKVSKDRELRINSNASRR